jgi:hypothetical protein
MERQALQQIYNGGVFRDGAWRPLFNAPACCYRTVRAGLTEDPGEIIEVVHAQTISF